jgi:hypothetical protein
LFGIAIEISWHNQKLKSKKSKAMKQSTNTLRSLQNLVTKVFFCSQLIIISSALPSLFYVGITHNNEKRAAKHLLITNKGKRTLVSAEEAGGTIKYSPAFMHV